jgi:phosphate transport system permease protein
LLAARGRPLSRWRVLLLALQGDAIVWLSGAAASLALLAVFMLLLLLAVQGLAHFWPQPLLALQLKEGAQGAERPVLAQVMRRVAVQEEGDARAAAQRSPVPPARWLLRLGNRDHLPADFAWVSAPAADAVSRPESAVLIERRVWGPMIGFLAPARAAPGPPDNAPAPVPERWPELERQLAQVQRLREELALVEREQARWLAADPEAPGRTPLGPGMQTPAPSPRLAQLSLQRAEIQQSLAQYRMQVQLADGRIVEQPLADVVRVVFPNRMGFVERLLLCLERLWEFLATSPRDANAEGGVFPAIFGTVTLVLLMSVLVTPMGVFAAVYLHEYARQGPMTRLIRIAVNNLAGVPSLVYGVFGLGFFVYVVGGELDAWLFAERLPSPTFGTPGLLWAALTLALLTLPVVVVATEEGLARIPRSLREGSLALGATRAETLWHVVLPMATPAMLTGLILAIARAAGEVAPLMLVGVVKLADDLPVGPEFPWLNLEQKFMHLGFHIYDVGFQSPHPDASRPLVYATALLLVAIIVLLNLLAILLRAHLREKYKSMDT